MRRIPAIAILVLLIGTLPACGGDGGPPEGFEVTGTWQERDGASTITFTAAGGYDLGFAPALSRFAILLGLPVTEVTATIGSDEVLSFDLDGRRFRFTKGG